MTPIEIAGERIDPWDWDGPMSNFGNPAFFTEPYQKQPIEISILLDDGGEDTNVTHFWRKRIADDRRCHFLDKARKLKLKQRKDGVLCIKARRFWCQCDQMLLYKTYLASAAKWARIGKGVGK